jgi:hypothetical protein
MKRNLLAAVKANTSPISEHDFESFLVKRHGAVSRENASADPSALDSIGKDSLKSKQSKTRQYVALKGQNAQRHQAKFKAAKGTKEANKTIIKSGSAALKKKVTF